MEIKEIKGRKYVYERKSIRIKERVRHTSRYIGPLIAVYKRSKRHLRKIRNALIRAVSRQIKSRRNRKVAVVYVISHYLEQYYEDVRTDVKELLAG